MAHRLIIIIFFFFAASVHADPSLSQQYAEMRAKTCSNQILNSQACTTHNPQGLLTIDALKILCEQHHKAYKCDQMKQSESVLSCDPTKICQGTEFDTTECMINGGKVAVEILWSAITGYYDIANIGEKCAQDKEKKLKWIDEYNTSVTLKKFQVYGEQLDAMKDWPCDRIQSALESRYVNYQKEMRSLKQQGKIAQDTSIGKPGVIELAKQMPIEELKKTFQEAQDAPLFNCLTKKAANQLLCSSAVVASSAVLGVAAFKKALDSYRHQLKLLGLLEEKGTKALARELTIDEISAIEQAHLVGKGEPGRNGKPASIDNYTEAQLREKAEILRQAGFDKEERRALITSGTVGEDAAKVLDKFDLEVEKVGAAKRLETDEPEKASQAQFLKEIGYRTENGKVVFNPNEVLKKTNAKVEELVQSGKVPKEKAIYAARMAMGIDEDGNIFTKIVRYDGSPPPKGMEWAPEVSGTVNDFWKALSEGNFIVGDPHTKVYTVETKGRDYMSDAFTHDKAHMGGFIEHPDFMVAAREIAQQVAKMPLRGQNLEQRLSLVTESMISPKAGTGPEINKFLKNIEGKLEKSGSRLVKTVDDYFSATGNLDRKQLLQLYEQLKTVAKEDRVGALPRDTIATFKKGEDRNTIFVLSNSLKIRELATKPKYSTEELRYAVSYALAHADHFRGMSAADIARDLASPKFESTRVHKFYCTGAPPHPYFCPQPKML